MRIKSNEDTAAVYPLSAVAPGDVFSPVPAQVGPNFYMLTGSVEGEMLIAVNLKTGTQFLFGRDVKVTTYSLAVIEPGKPDQESTS